MVEQNRVYWFLKAGNSEACFDPLVSLGDDCEVAGWCVVFSRLGVCGATSLSEKIMRSGTWIKPFLFWRLIVLCALLSLARETGVKQHRPEI